MTKVKLYYQNIHGDDHVMITVDIETVSTVGDLKGLVVEQLKDSWSQQNPPFQLKKKHIQIHHVIGGELKAIKDNATQCNDEWVYLALEVFVNEIDAFDVADRGKIWQEDTEEKKLDDAMVDKEGDVKAANETLVHTVALVKVNGASLFCKDKCMPIATPVDPCGPIQVTELLGKTKMSLEQYQTLLQEKGKRHPLLKYLRTNLSRGKDWNRPLDSSLEPSPAAERFVNCTRREKNWAKQKGEPITVNKRASYFRFKVSSEQEECAKWKINGVDKVITPVGFLKWGENILEKEDLDSMLRIFYNPDEGTEPQFFTGTVGNKYGSFYLFPKAVAQFQLHDIKMEASAEPKAPEGDFDESVKTLYEAALILFYASDDEGVQKAIV
ncbi:hypothetical protein SEMRO_4_G003300.1 [Seminavis robusta]|uniref:Uncharacterized protein n=1 Tax=Seminavis robusta TaxID=568900 RepID=A0A9N8D9E1_9STRA|nr:hypothetical protein SEMRO_4_G003300.1 [Seminavis robusta]|eukprot:Sro4_g003300.1 n/a (383) ;mRNA; f:108241-109618